MVKQLCENEKKRTEEAIEHKLGEKSKTLLDPKISNEKFLSTLLEVCTLNAIRDNIKK